MERPIASEALVPTEPGPAPPLMALARRPGACSRWFAACGQIVTAKRGQQTRDSGWSAPYPRRVRVVGTECLERIRTYLDADGVPYEIKEHLAAYTAQQLAQIEHVPGRTVAKVVMAVADVGLLMLVLPAPEQVDLLNLGAIVGKTVRLAHEEDFVGAFTDCEAGAMPPFGNLYDIPVYVDGSFDRDSTIVFPAGTHRQTLSLTYADFERLVQPVVASFAALP